MAKGKNNYFNRRSILVVAFILIVAGLFLFTKLYQVNKMTPTDIAKLEVAQGGGTYSNKQYGFSVKYPYKWSVDDKFQPVTGPGIPTQIVTARFGTMYTVDAAGQTVTPYVGNAVNLVVYYSESTDSDLVKNYVLNHVSEELIGTQKDITVDGVKGKDVKHGGCQSGDCRQIIFQKGNYVFDFSDQNSLPELDAMLSTFKFTDLADPKDFVESVFNTYVACDNNNFVDENGDLNPNPNPVNCYSKYIDPNSTVSFASTKSSLCIGNGGPPDNGISTDLINSTEDSAKITLHYIFSQSRDVQSEVDLVKENNIWKINRMKCSPQ